MIIASMYPSPFDTQERHDQNSALIVNNDIYAYEEDKLTMVKKDCTIRFPERSLMMGFKELNIRPHQVDHWVFPTPQNLDIDSMYLFFEWIMKAYRGSREEFDDWFKKKVYFVPHQVNHASLAIYGSNFKEAAFLCLDGGGDFGDRRNYIFGEYKNQEFNILKSGEGSYNIGSFHGMLTDSLGFGGESGKVSGLASYGKVIPELFKLFANLISVSDNGIIFDRKRYSKSEINLQKIKPREYDRTSFINTYPSDTNIFRLSRKYLPQDIAATGESVLVDSVIKLLKIVRKLTNLENAVFSGGIFQNVSLNNAIHESGFFKNNYFPMGSGDSGQALGSALYLHNKIKNKNRPFYLSPFLGPSFSDENIKSILESSRMVYNKEENISKKVARLISSGNIIGFFQGRGEYGPRSLGNRSLLADPRKIEMKQKINQLLKKRDWFMPYAPSVMEEYVEEYATYPTYSPYMQIAFSLHKSAQKKIPAGIHVDGSSRLHVVSKRDNPLYWDLLNEFRLITGLPVLLNTSFNRHGIPTISDPKQAVEHLLDGCMDYLAISNFLISYQDNRKSKSYEIPKNSEKICLKLDSIKRLGIILSEDLSKHEIDDYVLHLNKLLDIKLKFNSNTFIIDGIELTTDKVVEYLSSKISNSI